VKLKVRIKTSKKFKKGISFVFTVANLHCFTIQQSIQYCSYTTNWSCSSFNVSCELVSGPILHISVHPRSTNTVKEASVVR